MLTTEIFPWNADAAALLKQFLSGITGQLFLAHLALRRPIIPTGVASLEQTALIAREVAGYDRILSEIVSLTEPPPVDSNQTPTATNYPDPDDDSQWPSQPAS